MKKQWDVDWTESVPTDEFGFADIDSAVTTTRRFPTREQAMTFAKQAARESYWSIADVRSVREVSRADIESDDHLEWWIEGRTIMAYAGDAEEVEA